MSPEPGHKLAHYEVVDLIGKGGMGEVHRVKDEKLGRDGAIKVLPEVLRRGRTTPATFSSAKRRFSLR